MPRSFRPIALAVLVIAAAVARPSPTILAQGTAREQTLFVGAIDSAGAPVENLGLADFVVREDGTRREVLRVSRATEPLDIALLIDTSAASGELVPRVRQALKGFVDGLEPSANVAMITLADRPTVLLDYTSDHKRIVDASGRLFTQSMSGMTLLDAIAEVSKGLERRDTPRAVIVPIVSDGIEFTNRYYRDVIDAMTRAQVGLYALAVGTFDLTNDEAVRNREYVLQQGTEKTGGQRIMLLTALSIEPALQKLARELSSQYKVVYGRPETLLPPEKVEVTASRSGITMHAQPLRSVGNGARQ